MYIKETNKYKKMKNTDIINMYKNIDIYKENGDEKSANKLYDKIVMHNMNLVTYILHKYFPTYNNDSDIFQSAMVGLVKAVRTYDYNKGFAISSYLGRIIKNEIIIFINSNSVIKSTTYTNNVIYNIENFKDKYYVKHGVIPDNSIIKNHIGISKEKTIKSLSLLLLNGSSLDVASNDNNEDNSTTIINYITYDDEILQDTLFDDKRLHADVKNILNTLDDNEKILVEMYFGFNDENKQYGTKHINDYISSPGYCKSNIKHKLNKILKYEEFKNLSEYI